MTTYEQLRAYLAVGTRKVIDDWPEFVHTHAAEEDPDWPTPETTTDAVALLKRLPVAQREACLIIALRAILPTWTHWLSEAVISLPYLHELDLLGSIASLRWIPNAERRDRVWGLQEWQMFDSSVPHRICRFVDCLCFTDLSLPLRAHDVRVRENEECCTLLGWDAPEDGMAACVAREEHIECRGIIADARHAAEEPGLFLSKWWTMCRTALAWHDPTSGELSWE